MPNLGKEMERTIEMNGCSHRINGQWATEGMSSCFRGQLLNSETNKIVASVDYSFPFSFERKFGIEAMQDEIVISIKEYFEQNA
jgi:hypothetical protein